MLEVARRSPITGTMNTTPLDITASQLELWEDGEGLIQDIMPNLNKHEREFLISGCTKEDWINLYGEDE
jgi:hypothetical protein